MPGPIADLAESCVRFVEKSVGVAPDFTQDTLPLVDHYLKLEENLSDEVLSLVVPACGAYFGEVLRRHLGGSWDCPSEDYTTWTVDFSGSRLKVQPIVIAFEAAKSDTEGSGGLQIAEADREFATKTLEAMGEVREQDFTTLAVRFEVIEHLVVKLAAPKPN